MFRTPIVILSVVVFASAALAEPAGRALSPRREAESAWGLSLRPPEGTRLIRRTADAYLMRIYDDDGKFQILLSVRRATQPLTVAEILQEAEANLRRVHGTAQRLDQRELEVAGRAAGIIYFDSPRTSGDGRMLLGQAFVPLAVDTLAVLEVEAAMEERPLAAATFEAVLDSLEVGVEQIEAQRMTAVRQTAEFQSNLQAEAVRKAVIEQQLFRIVETPEGGRRPAERDIGWMRMRQAVGERIGKEGVAVEVQSRFFIEDRTYDSLAVYFAADDGSYEDWTIRTTQRPTSGRRPRGATTDRLPTDVETGIRTGAKIEVRIEREGVAVQNLTFTRPDVAYLPQAHAWLLPQLLAADEPATYGFYWYNSPHQKIVYRSDQVVPALDRFTIITHTAPDEPELRATYDGDRRLVDKTLSPMRRLVPTTAEELRRRWPQG